VKYVLIWDPQRFLKGKRLRLYRLAGRRYKEMTTRWLRELGIDV
jgi:hypothetical protein